MELPAEILPKHISGYRILRRLAVGAASDVLLAERENHETREDGETVVVLKLLDVHGSQASLEAQFQRELLAYARLSHPAIVGLREFFMVDGRRVMTLEYVNGLSLSQFRDRVEKLNRPIRDEVAYMIAYRVFSALAAAHSMRDPEDGYLAPVVHRELNPSKILIGWDGTVKVTDFGISKPKGIRGDDSVGVLRGTQGYIAPEQVRGEIGTARSDIYAATLLLWELLARRRATPRQGISDSTVMRALSDPQLESLDQIRPDVLPTVRDAVRRGLEPSPERRKLGAEEMAKLMLTVVDPEKGRKVLADSMAGLENSMSEDRGDEDQHERTLITREDPTFDDETLVRTNASGPFNVPPESPLPPVSVSPPTRDILTLPDATEMQQKFSSHPPPVSAPPPIPPFNTQGESTLLYPDGHLPFPDVHMPSPLGAPPEPIAPSPLAPLGAPAFLSYGPDSADHPPWKRSFPIGKLIGLFAAMTVLVVAIIALHRHHVKKKAHQMALAESAHAAAIPPPIALPAPHPIPPPPAAAVPAPSATASASTTPSASAPASAAGNMATLRVTHPGKHRVFVDNKVVGSSPLVLEVTCGHHSVRVGSSGKPREVDTPCGADVTVQ